MYRRCQNAALAVCRLATPDTPEIVAAMAALDREYPGWRTAGVIGRPMTRGLTCIATDCDRPQHAVGLCSTHYRRVHARHGVPACIGAPRHTWTPKGRCLTCKARKYKAKEVQS